MRTIQDYECPVHGRFEVVCMEDPEDIIKCPEGDPACDQWAEHRISAPAVKTHDTTLRALTGHVRDTNPRDGLGD